MAEAQQALADARQRVAELEQAVQQGALAAPSDGVVTAVTARPGDTVQAGQSAVVMTPSDDLVVGGAVPADASGRITADMPGWVTLDVQPNARLGATVAAVADEPSGSQSVSVRVAWPSRAPAPGAGAKAVITLAQRDGVLVVPTAALQTQQGQRFVTISENGTTRSIPVEVGAIGPEGAEIVSGLEEGQVVVVGP